MYMYIYIYNINIYIYNIIYIHMISYSNPMFYGTCGSNHQMVMAGMQICQLDRNSKRHWVEPQLHRKKHVFPHERPAFHHFGSPFKRNHQYPHHFKWWVFQFELVKKTEINISPPFTSKHNKDTTLLRGS